MSCGPRSRFFGSGVAASLPKTPCFPYCEMTWLAMLLLGSMQFTGSAVRPHVDFQPESVQEKDAEDVNAWTMDDGTLGWGSTDSEVTKCQNYIDKTLRAKHHAECPYHDYGKKDAFHKKCGKVASGEGLGCHAFYYGNCRCPVDLPECRTKPGEHDTWTNRKKSILDCRVGKPYTSFGTHTPNRVESFWTDGFGI